MNNLKSIKTTAAMATAITLSLCCNPALVNAQCVPGMGATSAELSTQTFPTRVSTDYASLPFSSQDIPAQAFGNLTSVATDGNRIQVLDTSHEIAWEIGSTSSGPAITGAYRPNLLRPFDRNAQLIDAGGAVWVTNPGGQSLTALGHCVWAPGGEACEADTLYYTGTLQINRVVTGGAFDGTNIWFSTTTGQLVQVSPPIKGASTASWTAPAVIGAVAIGTASLDNLVFDGRYIWVSTVGKSGPALLQFDPNAREVVATHPMPASVTSLVYDGTFFWVGAESLALQYDPLNNTSKHWGVPGNTVLFNGMTTDVFGSGEHVSYRGCDMAQAAKDKLPGTPSGIVMVNGQYWVVFGDNTLSVR